MLSLWFVGCAEDWRDPLGISRAGDGSTLDKLGNPLSSAILEVSPAEINVDFAMGNPPLSREVTVTNVGGFDLYVVSIEIGDPADSTWLVISGLESDTVVLSSLDSAQLILNYGSSFLDKGEISGTVRFLWYSNEPGYSINEKILPVTLSVSEITYLFEPTLSKIQTNIFRIYCTECHSGNGAPKNLRLDTGKSYENLVNVPSKEKSELKLVIPDQPESSYLVHKIEGGPDIVGQRMPRDAPPLNNELVKIIRRWIQLGAENN